jgi:NitT/TauT family transport system substrate-binding protein
LKGRKFGINSFGASDDYTVYTFLSKSGLDPTRDVTLLSIGGTSARFAALAAGVVDAAATLNRRIEGFQNDDVKT